MNCYVHDRSAAVGLCAVCQKAMCRECVGRDAPRVICRVCIQAGVVLGFEYRSRASIGAWPVVHICTGYDPATMRPRVAKGVLAIGNIAIGVVAIGGVACGLLAVGGVSLGLLLALGGVAAGLGVSAGGLAVGSFALGGAAIGLQYAIGGATIGPAVINGLQCDPAALEFLQRWVSFVGSPPSCR